MAEISKTLKLVWEVEYNNDPKRALEQNPGETGLTYKGIYETAHPNWAGWTAVKSVLMKCGGDKKKAGVELENDVIVQKQVEDLYKEVFWDKMQLDKINVQKIADEMFVFGLNVGIGHAIRAAQRIASVQQDGVIGPKTIQALNKLDETVFDETYDILEVEYYEKLGEQPRFAQFVKGWRNRAYFV
jgi:lysozyme family protein